MLTTICIMLLIKYPYIIYISVRIYLFVEKNSNLKNTSGYILAIYLGQHIFYIKLLPEFVLFLY